MAILLKTSALCSSRSTWQHTDCCFGRDGEHSATTGHGSAHGCLPEGHLYSIALSRCPTQLVLVEYKRPLHYLGAN